MTRIPLAPVARDGHRVLIACDECPKDFWANAGRLAGSGVRCPSCGTLHQTRGRLITITPKDEPR